MIDTMLGSGTSRSNTPTQNTKSRKKNKSERNNNKLKLEKCLRKNFSIRIDFSFSLKGFRGRNFISSLTCMLVQILGRTLGVTFYQLSNTSTRSNIYRCHLKIRSKFFFFFVSKVVSANDYVNLL